jgi:hypothetical protein
MVSASGRGPPASSDIAVRQEVSNAHPRDTLNDLRNQTDKPVQQQNRANDAIEELQLDLQSNFLRFPLLPDDLLALIYCPKTLTLSRTHLQIPGLVHPSSFKRSPIDIGAGVLEKSFLQCCRSGLSVPVQSSLTEMKDARIFGGSCCSLTRIITAGSRRSRSCSTKQKLS